MKIILAGLVLLVTCTVGLCQEMPNKAADKIRAVKSVTGTTVGFEIGDYQHVTVQVAGGKRRSFFLGSEGLDYFLAANKSRKIVYTFEVVDSFVPENGGPMRIERLKSAKVGTLTFEHWWQELKQKHSSAEIDKRYQPLVDKYRLN
jgi:hypothetical protein